ncbi:MAG: MBL fold metallo-hydrolase [Candidatus Nanoarchaeia archaeon]
MQDKIIFLGSGGSRIMLATQLLNTGGFIIQTQGYQIWVDPGPGALVQARRYNINSQKTDIIFVSHHHLDHSNDLNAIIDAMTLGGIRQKGVLISTNQVINGSQEENPTLHKFYRAQLKNVFALKPNDKVVIGPLKFIATQTVHDCDEIGFKLETPLGNIGYTGDTGYFSELSEIFKNCKVLIANVLRPGNEQWKTHLTSALATELFKECKPNIGVITNFGVKMLKANPLSEARAITKASNVNVFAARNGLTIDLKTLFTQ